MPSRGKPFKELGRNIAFAYLFVHLIVRDAWEKYKYRRDYMRKCKKHGLQKVLELEGPHGPHKYCVRCIAESMVSPIRR